MAMIDNDIEAHYRSFSLFVELATRFNVNVNWDKSKIDRRKWTSVDPR